MSKRFGFLAVGLVFLLAGCMEERVTVTVNADGSGKMHFKQKLGSQASSFMLMGDGDAQAGAKKALVQELAKWNGVVAWTDLASSVEDERIVLEATGWFEDANAVARGENAFVWTKTGAEATFEWKGNSQPGAGDKKPLQEKVQTDKDKKMAAGILAELDVERAIVCPGKVSKAEGGSVEGNTARFRIKGAELRKKLDAFNEKLAAVKAKVEKKELTEDQGNAELAAPYAELNEVMPKVFKITCSVEESDAAAWKKDLEAAKKAWDAAEQKKAVDEKKAAQPK